MAYDDKQVYAKYLKKKCQGEGCGDHDHHDHGCNGCEDECSCCPPGTVEVVNVEGKVVGCLTPNDTQQYMIDSYACPPGYVKTIDPVTGKFMGCLTPDEYKIIYP